MSAARGLRVLVALGAWLAAARPAVARAADPDPSEEPSLPRFYWHEAIGAGVYVHHNSYSVSPGTVDVLSADVDLVTTLGARVTRLIAVGGEFRFGILPSPTVTEERCCGARDIGSSFALAGGLGPALMILPAPFRLDLSPGIIWSVAAPKPVGSPIPGAAGSVRRLRARRLRRRRP